jgi:uncharacterized protein YqgC (DUF456 family)
MSHILSDPFLTGAFIVMGLSLIAMLAVPILPGQFIIWLAALIYGLIAGWPVLGWGTFIILTVLMLIAGLTDEVARWVGARGGGASWTAIAAGFILGAIGMILFEFVGAILGAVVGIAYVEYRKNKDWNRSLKAAGGYVAGWLGSLVIRFGIAVLMVIIFAIRVL